MAHVERDIFIEASPADVEAYMGNPANSTEWYEGIVEVQAEHDKPVVGAVITQTYTVAGNRMDMTLNVTEYEPVKTVTFAMDGMITGTYRWDFIPEGDGVRVKGTVDYEMAGGILGKIADKLVVERMNITQMEQSLENVKRIMEE